MASYMIMRSQKTGRWLVKEKRYLTTVAKAETREEACKMLHELKEADRVKAKAKKESKEQTKVKAEGLVVGKLGKTKQGKTYLLEGNCGLEERSRHCYTLTIDGDCIFTSGTLEAAARYIENN